MKILYLTGEFIYKLHLKTDISFCVQFNTELPCQEMNFPILVVTTPIYLFSSVLFVTVRRKALKESS